MFLQLTADDHYLKTNKEIDSQEKILTIEKTVLDFVNDRLTGLAFDFNVFVWKREELYGLFLGMFVKTGIAKQIESLPLLLDFAIHMAENYCDNPYHSFLHAIDVTYMCYFLTENMSIGEQIDMTLTDKAVLLLSALGHDVLHPGTNNLFQVNSKNEVALKYNNVSVLEQQSADFVKKYLEKSKLLESLNVNVQEIEGDTKKSKIIFRICEHIIQTDMVYHFGLVEQLTEVVNANRSTHSTAGSSSLLNDKKLKAAVESRGSISDSDRCSLDREVKNCQMPLQNPSSCYSLNLLATITIPKTVKKDGIMHAILHAADISNPARPFATSKKWADLVLVEFLNQGRLEKQNHLPISPNMEEDSVNQIESQLSFVEFIVEPLFMCFVELFPRSLSLMDLITDNCRLWTSLKEKSEKLDVAISTSPSAPSSAHSSPYKSALTSSPLNRQGRKLSFAAGTIEIPERMRRNSQGKYRSISFLKTGYKENSDLLLADDLKEEAEP